MTTVEATQIPTFSVAKVGGIDETTVEIPPGVTVLAGENATNRTSFMQAIKAVLGSHNASLKGDADEGSVSMTLAGEEYHRTLTRQNGHVTFSGEPYLDDPTLADLFAFLLESNEARQIVAFEGDLRELIMRPVDVDEIKADIEQLEAEKGEINEELAEIESLKQDLPTLEQRRTSLRSEIEDVREELETKEGEIEDASASVEETREEKAELEEKLEELRSTRNDLEQVRYETKSTEESITSLNQERTELQDELEELPETPMGEHSNLDDQIQELREQKQHLDQGIQDLQSVIQFNEEMLNEEGDALLDELVDETGEQGDLTAQLVEEGDTVCWTCGSEVAPGAIESTLDSLRSMRTEKLEDSGTIDDEISELQSEQRAAKQQQRERDRVEDRLEGVDEEIDTRQTRREELHDRKATLTTEVEALESNVDELESQDFSEVLDLHKEANQLEFELDRLESDLADVSDEIESIEQRIAAEDDLVAERDRLLDELESCRTRIDQIEADAVEEFNTHMDAILDVLGYDNLDRIWIERLEQTVREGRQKVQQTVFELHVVRSTENGTAYEDTIDHLSESEREVTGLIFALAGYLVHDVHEVVPFMLLDSLEAIDSDRIAKLVDYFADYAEYVVVALLPEDAQALSEDYARITSI